MRQQQGQIEEQEDKMRQQQGKIEEQDSQMRAAGDDPGSERLLELNRILVREKKYDLLEQIQEDPALCEKLMVQYEI